MDPVDELLMIDTVKRLEEAVKNALGRISDLEREAAERAAVDVRRSSIEVGTPAKGGALKVYFDPFGKREDNVAAVNEAKYVLGLAGGQPLQSTLIEEVK